MTQKLEALHLEALCNEVRKMSSHDCIYQLVIIKKYLKSVLLLLFALVEHKVDNFVKYM